MYDRFPLFCRVMELHLTAQLRTVCLDPPLRNLTVTVTAISEKPLLLARSRFSGFRGLRFLLFFHSVIGL